MMSLEALSIVIQNFNEDDLCELRDRKVPDNTSRRSLSLKSTIPSSWQAFKVDIFYLI